MLILARRASKALEVYLFDVCCQRGGVVSFGSLGIALSEPGDRYKVWLH